MPRRPDSDPALFAVTPTRRGKGRHERSVDRAIAAARDADRIGDLDAGSVAMLRALGRALDSAETEDSPYSVTTVTRELRQALDACGLMPERVTPTPVDPFAALLDDLDGANNGAT